MKALIGYLLAGLGIVSLALSSPKIVSSLSIPLLGSIASNTFMVAGGVLVVAGLIVLFLSNKDSSSPRYNITQAAEEVPIYEGEGKHRKIVGYKKQTK